MKLPSQKLSTKYGKIMFVIVWTGICVVAINPSILACSGYGNYDNH